MGKVIQFKNKDQKQLEMDFEQDQVVLDNMTITDKQTVDATELLVEYAFECGGDIQKVVASKELGEVIKHLHIMFGLLNGVESYELDEERNLDMSYMYNDDGLLHDQFDPEDDAE
jgi:hypothetical protein|tara:strand:+ start:524 stop:868 length:345 start_codon:yes stop_codon:yes gene_type:complete